ncbi:MAG: NAD-glutamate dehydrogenase [bacterium]|nr:MAG: NAD-glutamate dehydrogenase [bacterium]
MAKGPKAGIAEPLISKIRRRIGDSCHAGERNLDWLREHIHPYFFITMREEVQALSTLASGMDNLAHDRRLVLADRDKVFILACMNRPGSVYNTLRTLQEREISYIEIIHSYGAPPGLPNELEIQKYEFDRKDRHEITRKRRVSIPDKVRKGVRDALRRHYPEYDFSHYEKDLSILFLNNRDYVGISPFRRIAQVLQLYDRGIRHGGTYLDVEEIREPDMTGGYRVLFAAGNPPQEQFLLQILEIFNRLKVAINRTYSLIINNGIHPYFLGTFYVRARDTVSPARDSEVFFRLRQELYNTQVLSSESLTYREFVRNRIMDGEDASLVNAFIAFCHTNLAHNQPDVYELETVERAFHGNPEISRLLVSLFRVRFDPEVRDREASYRKDLEETETAVARYNTGHRRLDQIRRNVFRCCLSFIRHTLKTNFFVLEKQALSFRLDPSYLTELDPSFTADLPSDLPFRVTFFFGRYGFGYHIGFSDIARGGWRTVVVRTQDDFITSVNSLFREVYVLAHTQHLKNKDIYEGGSKMVVVVDGRALDDRDLVDQRMYKAQYGFINAFLDIFVTEGGRARESRVVDFYGEEEAIELGPDENMHDSMVEAIAWLSVNRGYLLGSGIISSKKVGINHKEYGVTSTGVVTFAEVTMAELGLDMRRDRFTVKLTGGPNGDVAGNAIRLLLDRCPRVKIVLILDGSGVLYDPEGLSRAELRRILFRGDVDAFRTVKLHPGGFLLYRSRTRQSGLVKLFWRVARTEEGFEERWVSLDRYHREFDEVIFTTPADLFIPAGGRPETIHEDNWHQFFPEGGPPTVKAIVEGANSFLTPEARDQIQKKGVIVMRDASANKCGVISSSYEVIANLLMTEEEFLAEKDRYVSDVLSILERRAADEARLILARHREAEGRRLYTEISDEISREINSLYGRLFDFLQRNPEMCEQVLFRKALLDHMPDLIREKRKYRSRIGRLPSKYRYAILASEIASSLVYRSSREADFEDVVVGHLRRVFSRTAGDRT